jgi:hypothetical protein
MRSTIVLRLGALVTVSALALSLGTMPSSAAESPQPFGTKSSVLEDRPNARLATGADLKKAGASRSTGGATISAVNITDVDGHSGVLNNPVENYIDVEVYGSDDVDFDYLTLYLTVDGKKTTSLDVWYDPDLDVTFVIVPDTVGLGKAYFYGTKIYYTEESGKAPTWDSTDSNYFYVRRDIYPDASAGYETVGNTKMFGVSAMGIYSPSINGFKTLGSIKLQYKTSNGWKTKTEITLDNGGNGTVTFSRTTKFYYRIISSRTSTWIGFTQNFPKI